ncbi:CBN-SMC-5 protein [Caenorhabditis brenneri]|uniref:Structural maintenance of chromosomes protein 5 n=1 Tax=Caenorhabditis brenneri TaxID=135651 RepID=G0PCC1_CAEBE|nr:CBN-SMC-5 protein [Caenorhabditis brenneri]
MPLATDESLPSNYQEFPDGSILRMVFHNFLTYEHTCFIPTQNLNMILGHNGSGKSSIICGICLACGGSPKTLGRSEKISDYIRHGCQEGYVEIAIADENKGPQTIRLTLRVGKAPEYRLNNSVATQTHINDLRKQYNIQIDNPCAFLAQDKVKSFSEQSAIELLRNTEKAASDDLDRIHRELIGQRVDSTTIEDKCVSSDKAVKHLEDEITKIQPLVENYRKKLALQSKLRLLEKKKKILEYEEADKELQDEKMKADDALKEYREAENSVEDCERRKKILEEKARRERSAIVDLRSKAMSCLASVQEDTHKKLIETELGRAKTRLDDARKQASNHEQKVSEIRDNLEAAKRKLEEAKEDAVGFNEFKIDYDRKEAKFRAMKEEVYREESKDPFQGEIVSLQNKVRSAPRTQNIMDQRLNEMRRKNEHAWKAYTFYLENRDIFKGPVYMPLMDIILKSPEAATLLENSFSIRDRFMFVCTNKDDEKRLNNDKVTWRINTSVVYDDKVDEAMYEAKLPSQLRKVGFDKLITECFDAPPPLKQYMCNVSGIHKIPFGNISHENMDLASKTLSQFHMEVYLTPRLRVCIMFFLIVSNFICRLLSNHPSILEILYKQKKEQEEWKNRIAEKIREVHKKQDMMKQEFMNWRAKLHSVRKWENDIRKYKDDFEILGNSTVNVEEAEQDYKKAERSAVEKTKKMMNTMLEGQKQVLEHYREIGRRSLISAMCNTKASRLIVEANTHREKLLELKDMKDHAENHLRAAVNKKKVARNNLILECELQNLDEEAMNVTEKKVWEQLNKMFKEAEVPTDIDTLTQSITNERTRLKLAEDSGEDGSEDHEQRLAKLEVDLATENTKREKLINNRKNLHDKLGSDIDTWKKGIDEMIEQINKNYIKFFEFLGCRGEVSLDIPENPLDIEKYGIMIMVCFRKGESMKRLDNKVQSGGERSVATMLYLLALQQLCPVPFRCIDEINQGMDPTNERKVFEIMVGLWNGTAGTLSKTQYFLLSPKLLHGLDLRDNVNIILANSTLETNHRNVRIHLIKVFELKIFQFYKTTSKLDALFAEMGIAA